MYSTLYKNIVFYYLPLVFYYFIIYKLPLLCDFLHIDKSNVTM